MYDWHWADLIKINDVQWTTILLFFLSLLIPLIHRQIIKSSSYLPATEAGDPCSVADGIGDPSSIKALQCVQLYYVCKEKKYTFV